MWKRLGKRLLSWARTMTKLALLVLCYFWLGAAYKLVYAQTHDLSRYKGQLPISYYQREYIIDALLHQTWILGPDFRDYVGEPPSLGALASGNPIAGLAGYLKEREQTLGTFPERYPYSLFTEEALEDGYLISQGAATFSLAGNREEPRQVLMSRGPRGTWSFTGVPDMSRPGILARHLANDYPNSPQAPQALKRLAESEQQAGREPEVQEAFRRLSLEYPDAEESVEAAEGLYKAAQAAGRLEEARDYRMRALKITERVARRKFPGRALPAQNAVHVMGFRVDVATLELGLRNIPGAASLLNQASQEAARLEALPSKDEALRNPLEEASTRLDRAEDELWVARAYQGLKVESPGPAPRGEENSVSGSVRFAGKPLPGVEVLLTRFPMDAVGGMGALGMLGQVRYRDRTDRLGRYEIGEVPIGGYYLSVMTPSREAGAEGRPLIPAQAQEIPPRLVVKDRPLQLAPLFLTTGLATRTFGEQSTVNGKIPILWEPYPGATSYRVEVLAGVTSGEYLQRVPEAERPAFLDHPVLWKAVVKTPQADCPLASLAADQPINTRMISFEYAVTALDAKGRKLAESSLPLCRFVLSASAFRELLLANPPNRGSRGRFRMFPRRRQQ